MSAAAALDALRAAIAPLTLPRRAREEGRALARLSASLAWYGLAAASFACALAA